MGNCKFIKQKKQVKINGEWVDTRSVRYLPYCNGENPCVIVKDGGPNGSATVTLSNSEEKKLSLDKNGNGYLALGSNDSISTINLSPNEALQSCVVEISGCKLEKIKVTGANSLIISCSTFNSHPDDWWSDVPCFDGTSIIFKGTNTSNLTNMQWMFYGLDNIQTLDLSGFDTSNVTSMEAAFTCCNNLTSLNMSSFNTRNVTDMSGMFGGCTKYDSDNNIIEGTHYCLLTSLDVSNFDTRNVTNMSAMFSTCTNLTSLDVSNFDTRNVTNMIGMFHSCSSLTSLDLSNFDTSNVTDLWDMFRWCEKLQTLDLSGWDLTKAIGYNPIGEMFFQCKALKTIYMRGCNQTTINKIKEGLRISKIPSNQVTIIT